ncbi:MAG: phosphatase PAP2 family protein [Gammaproteobacteria bacterium]|nr:phosphatase PAP2 family protein [Gammaproteobacteria bacterium]
MLNVLTNLDILLYRWLIRLQHSPSVTHTARFVSRSGDGYLYVLFGVIMLLLGGTHNLQFLKAGLLAFLIELPCFMILKAIIKRERPFIRVSDSSSIIAPADKFSMPSGHTTAAFLMATLIGHFFGIALIAVFCWATLIGISRVVLGVHYPSDILAGAVLGSSCATLGIVFVG